LTQSKEDRRRARDSSLDLDAESLHALAEAFVQLGAKYFDEITERRVFPDVTGSDLQIRFDEPPPKEGASLKTLIDDCRDVIAGSRHNGHPRFFGYVASPSTPVGAFADLLASTINPSVTSWRSSPAATQIEQTVVRWLGALIGYDDNAHGLLTSGGSMANLTALLIAHRNRSKSDVAETGIQNSGPRMTIYASDQVHFSIIKAADILGLGHESVRLAPTDDRFCVDVAAMRAAIERDRQQGLKPFCVVGSAGTAATGAIDSLIELGKIAREHDLWFHIDGAYGAPAAMIADQKPAFTGLELADSVSLDPHKWLYTPVDCGCLLFRDAAAARKTFTAEADYVKVHELAEIESFAFWDYGIELSRRFRALKIWLTLKYYGAQRIAAAIAGDIAIANYMAECVSRDSEFELLAPVQLSICCFRYVPARLRAKLESAIPPTGAQASRLHLRNSSNRDGCAPVDDEGERIESEINRLNEQIMYRVQRGGQAYLSNAMLRGKFALRACIINFRTTRADIDLTLQTVRDVARQIEIENGA
jgi:glutamate/tyrosine decarboxylase-like PLP-dependent enzyme